MLYKLGVVVVTIIVVVVVVVVVEVVVNIVEVGDVSIEDASVVTVVDNAVLQSQTCVSPSGCWSSTVVSCGKSFSEFVVISIGGIGGSVDI